MFAAVKGWRLLGGAALIAAAGAAGRGSDPWAAGFAQPPASARPATWWRWINGNITREAIHRDLSEMARHGIRSVGIFDVATSGAEPPPVSGMGMMSPGWQAMFQYAVAEAARLGIALRVSPAAGWGIGGPWVDGAHGARALEAAEIQCDGPIRLDQELPRASGEGGYYRDVALVAFREPPTTPPRPWRVSASSELGGREDEKDWPAQEAADGDPQTFWKTAAPPSAEHPAWLALEYPAPLQATGVFAAGAKGAGPRGCALEVSDNGSDYRAVATWTMAPGEARRIAFPPATGRFFRLAIASAHAADVRLAEFQVLRAGDQPLVRPGIEWWKIKTAHRGIFNWPDAGPAVLGQEYPPDSAAPDCRAKDVVDLSPFLSGQGRLTWNVPRGRWAIVRFGAVDVGEHSRMASKALSGGYEADVFSTAAADQLYLPSAHLLARASGSLAGRTLTGFELDSYEIGATVKGLQGNWTEALRDQFIRARGYDPLPYFPAMAGRIVDSRETTDRFLWDYRRTLTELYGQFYGRLAELGHRDHLKLWAENGYGTYPFPHIDGLAGFGRADVPMGEFWFARDKMSQFFPFIDSVRTAASAAHIYGKPIVGAEALTIGNGLIQAPGEWKIQLDREFANGMNLTNLNCWTLQYDVSARPGAYTYDLVNENLTWWGQSDAFLDYLSRCQYLLQQGLPVADVCYFYGEGSARFVPSREYLRPALPPGYEFDAADAEALASRLQAEQGQLRLPGGGSYRYLVMPGEPGWRVTPAVLRRIDALVRAGATIVGERPGGTPSLADYPQADITVRRLADGLWGKTGTAASVRRVGLGRVIAGKSLADVFALDGLRPDLDASEMTDPEKIAWCHRRIGDRECYFISNQAGRVQAGSLAFRLSGKAPEFWDPLTGQARAASAFTFAGVATQVPFELAPGASLFVVFRQAASAPPAGGENFPAAQGVAEITGPWEVSFDPAWGGRAGALQWDRLLDWSRSADPAIRYYAGPAHYRKSFDLPREVRTGGCRLYLDLGTVRNVATVTLNGRRLGTQWTAPWRVDVTDAVRPKDNRLEIEVADLWTNRLVHEQSLPPAQRTARTTMRPLKANTPLVAAGLLGPVSLVQVP